MMRSHFMLEKLYIKIHEKKKCQIFYLPSRSLQQNRLFN